MGPGFFRAFASLQALHPSAGAAPNVNDAMRAFVSRLGLAIPDSLLQKTMLYADGTALPSHTEFNELSALGKMVSAYCTMKYVQGRWPRLDCDGRRVAVTTYTSPGNMAFLGQCLGLPEALSPDSFQPPRTRTDPGYRRSLLTPKKIVDSAKAEKAHIIERSTSRRITYGHANTMHAIIGAVLASGNQQDAIRFVYNFILRGAQVDPRVFVRPLFPVAKLTLHLRKQGLLPEGQDLVFRLLKESGRLSNSSAYVVSVQATPDGALLGKYFGMSIKLAQNRACVDALRRLFLVDTGFEQAVPAPDAPLVASEVALLLRNFVNMYD